ncbi:MAG: 50S ribosomal protein L25/general stress protein Ctc [Betaproteobacteria bacterium]
MEFTAFPRSLQGSGASRRLRRAGKVPGIVYGVGEPTSIELDHNALFHALKNEKFHSSILSMKLEGKSDQVLLRDVQRHAFKAQVMHVDFQRIDSNSRIHMRVPLHFVNADVSPAVKISSAIISHVLAELDVACLPKDLPEFIEVDLSELTAGHAIHASDLKLPEGVTAVIRGQNKNPVVASAVVPRGAVEDAETADGAGATAAAASDVPTTAQKAPDAKAADGKSDDKGGKGGKSDKGGKK